MERMFTQEESTLLESLIGHRFRNVSGPALWHHLTAPLVYVATDQVVIAVEAISEEVQLEEDFVDLSHLRISQVEIGVLEECFIKGYVYKKYADSEIQSIAVVSDLVIGEIDGAQNLNYKSETAIALSTEEGILYVSKSDMNLPTLQVHYLRTLSLEDLPLVDSDFEDDINQKYYVTRKIKFLGQKDGLKN